MDNEMTTTNIDTVQDLFRILDENPEWLESLRAKILTKELLELPENHAALAANVATLTDDVVALTARVDALTVRMDALAVRMDDLTARVDALTTELAAFTTEMRSFAEEMRAFAKAANRRLDNIDVRFNRMESDNSDIKGENAVRNASREIANIVEDLGKVWIRNLGRDEIYALERAANIQGIPRGHLRSYRGADIIAEAVDADDDAQCYVVVEVSYTANGRDTTRAVRSAGLLSRFSGKPAYPVIAGVRVDNETREAIDAGEIQYYELEANR